MTAIQIDLANDSATVDKQHRRKNVVTSTTGWSATAYANYI